MRCCSHMTEALMATDCCRSPTPATRLLAVPVAVAVAWHCHRKKVALAVALARAVGKPMAIAVSLALAVAVVVIGPVAVPLTLAVALAVAAARRTTSAAAGCPTRPSARRRSWKCCSSWRPGARASTPAMCHTSALMRLCWAPGCAACGETRGEACSRCGNRMSVHVSRA